MSARQSSPRAGLTLTEALGIDVDDVVALVGGGKTTTMFRLAREMVEKGEHALTTTTTRIFAAQIALASACVAATDATCESLWIALGAHRQLLVIGATDAATGTVGGISLDLFGRLRTWCPRVAS